MKGSTIGKSQRSDILGGKGRTPGPGHFENDWAQASRMSCGSTFGPHANSKIQDDRTKGMLGNSYVPGPGAYNPPYLRNGAPAYSIANKPTSKDDSWQPGPGKY